MLIAQRGTIVAKCRQAQRRQRVKSTLACHVWRQAFADGAPAQTERQIRNQLVTIPAKQNNDITAQAQLTYTLRKVNKGDKSFREGDDKVVFIQGNTAPQAVSLIAKDAMAYTTYLLAETTGRYFELHIEKQPGDLAAPNPGVTFQPLKFTSYQAAFNFLIWLRSANFIRAGAADYRIGERKLILNGKQLIAGDVLKLQVKPLAENF